MFECDKKKGGKDIMDKICVIDASGETPNSVMKSLMSADSHLMLTQGEELT